VGDKKKEYIVPSTTVLAKKPQEKLRVHSAPIATNPENSSPEIFCGVNKF
jgi:hypothetical protein